MHENEIFAAAQFPSFQHYRPSPAVPCATPVGRALRPLDASKAAVCNGCFTSTPDVSFALTRSFAATWRTDQFDPCSPILAPRGVGLADRAPDADVDAMLCIERAGPVFASSGDGQ